MSSFQNPNYQPGAVIQNGYSPAVPPMHFQQQQQYSQQQAPQQLQQQQQEQQQQQQQQQGLKNPIINKYMPPTSQNLSSISPSIVQNTIVQPNQQHQIQTQLLQSAGNLAPNLRQQLNGTITNGASGNSSRTSSPSLNSPLNNSNSPQLIQSKPQQPTPTTSSATGFPLTNINKNVAPQSVPILQPNLSSSMQNLSLGNPSAPPGMFPPLQSQASNLSQRPTNNFQSNFRTSALNNSPSVTHTVNPVSASLTTNQSIISNQSINMHNRPLQQNSPLPPNSSFGTSVIPMLTKSTSQTPQTQYTQQISNILPPAPTTTSISSQNIINNNQHQQTNVPLNSQTNVMSSQPTQSARKPMYPSQKMLPQQFQQAYPQQQLPVSQNIQQQPTFNGQPNTGPMQYQQQNQYPNQQPNSNYNQLSGGVTQQGFNRLWGQDTVDLMQNRHILSPATLSLPKIVLHNQFHESINCNPDIIRCTLTKIPESNSLLQKSRLPLGLLIHPFRDINSLPVIQCPNIVRCRLCRTYINPFVYFVDTKMWKCNLCYRVNELSEDFQFDPATKTYGDVTRRPEVRLSTIEFIAPSEYMLRPPQPAVYLFLFDVSIIAQQSGYLENVCNILSKHLEDMPGDARAQVGFIAYNSEVHFYSMADGFNQPHEMTLVDIDDPFLPCPDNLLVNLKECKELIQDLLSQLPKRFADTHDPGSALGAALQVAYKLMMASGGRITVFQTCLPNKGAGALQSREDPNNRSAKDIAHLNPATDFYKRHALECSGYQIAVDLFLLNQQYSDLATISGVSKHSGGSVHHFPLYQKTKPQHVDSFKQCFKRYLTRKIGFEAVMRIRCTRGLQVHTFHGNFFVRSTDLLSLPNVNPDAGYGMQISYEETLTDVKTICFQAALLYTNSEGERRIRVHTLCLPVTSSLPEVLHSADAEAVVGLLSKMAVDRSLTSNIADARDAFINATIDILSAFKLAQNLPSGQSSALMAPMNLGILPLYILSLLKHVAFRIGTSTRLDDRVAAMDLMKTLPLDHLIKYIYPEFYNIDCLFYNIQNSNEADDDDALPDPMRLQLSAEYLDSRSMFLLDSGTLIIIYVGLNVPSDILEKVLGVKSTAELPDYCYGLPSLTTSENDALKSFINNLNDDKPYLPTIQIIRDTSTAKSTFVEKLIDDRSESSLSYYEFLQHLRSQVK